RGTIREEGKSEKNHDWESLLHTCLNYNKLKSHVNSIAKKLHAYMFSNQFGRICLIFKELRQKNNQFSQELRFRAMTKRF
ncbi:MAG: hypothetical protein LBP87_09255, partial [Planctomycetaceae bacterium]|nr:hypothetical protein [Planctomycetaceae bacterium]